MDSVYKTARTHTTVSASKEIMVSKFEELVSRIQPEWREAFVQFVETGEASQAFLDHLDADERAQEAVELAFQQQSRALEGLAEALREREKSGATSQAVQPVARAVVSIGRVLDTAMRLPKAQRHNVLQTAMTQASQELAVSADTRAIKDTLADLKDAAVMAEAAMEKETMA